jgi:hypothetical protein
LFYKKLIESTESSGSFFDKQLGTIVGNIKSVENPNEPVLGYFEVAGVRNHRAFFCPSDFDERFRPASFGYNCNFADAQVMTVEEGIEFLLNSLSSYQASSIKSALEPGQPDSVYIFPRTCTSCDWYAETEQPDFWIE